MAEYPVLSVRTSAQMLAAIDTAAARDGVGRSAWIKEVLVAGLRSGLPLAEVCARLAAPTAAPVVSRGVRPTTALGVVATHCLHPPHRIAHFETFSRCQACGIQVNVERDPDMTPRPLHAQAPAL